MTAAARSRTGAGQWTPMPPRLVEARRPACRCGSAAGSRRWGARPCLQGVCRQVLQQGSQRKRPGAVVNRFPLRWRQVADINPGRGRQRFAGFHHRGSARRARSAIRRAKVAPTGPLPIISTSMFSSISVHAFVVLRAHARYGILQKNRYYSFVRPDKWFLIMIAAIAGRDRSWLTRRKHWGGQQAAEGGNRQQDQGAKGQQGDKGPAPGIRRGGACAR